MDNWQFDMFKLERASNGHCLSLLAYHLFKRMDMIQQLRLSEMKLIRCDRVLGVGSLLDEVPWQGCWCQGNTLTASLLLVADT